jgi:hypothetical protein
LNRSLNREYHRAGLFTVVLTIIAVIGDGGPQRSAGLIHQLVLLPITTLFLFCLWRFLFVRDPETPRSVWTPRRAVTLVALFEVATAVLFFYQAHHFAAVGYRLYPIRTVLFFLAAVGLLVTLALRKSPRPSAIFVAALAIYIGGILLAIASFPLTYLRSDMFPVILWAGTNLLRHIDPYCTMHVADRVYNFPYLPGMIVVYIPFLFAHIDLRFASILFNTASASLIFFNTEKEHRHEVAVLLALFLLGPFLQYRHELYISPHWFTMIATFVLMQRRRFVWAAFACGISMAIYQFSWIIMPFVLLNAFRRRGWLEVSKLTLAALAGSLLIAGPFLRAAASKILGDTVTQWGLAKHADAQPMNLSYWATYFIHPSQLLKLQAILMVAIFAYCVIKRCCVTLEDTLRWIIVALTVFILFNVLVDGYFYLMLLVPMLIYTCVANKWWRDPFAFGSDATKEATSLS